MQRDRDQNRFKYRLVVGPRGDFLTIQAAIAWFNASATQNTMLQLDANDFAIPATIVINNPTYDLQIQGFEATRFTAATGLTGSPMFEARSNVDFRCIVGDGSTLASYGTLSTECFIDYTTNVTYSELVDDVFQNFYSAVHDTIGADLFMFNFVISDCVVGLNFDYTTNVGWTTMKELETGTVQNCTTGIWLHSAYIENFILGHLLFLNEMGQTCILYAPATYHPDGICNIIGCSYNNVGTFTSGFDFSRADGRDANIEIMSCVGTEDKKPHAKINVVDSTATTTCTTANVYYKLNFNSKKLISFNVPATSGNFTITIGDQTTASIAWNASAATIQTAINNLSNVTSVTVTQVTAAQTWTVEFLTAGEGWLGMMPVVNLGTLSPTTSADVTPDTYSCKLGITNNRYTLLSDHKQDLIVWVAGAITEDNNGRNINVGIKKNGLGMPLGPVTVRVVNANQPTPFASIVYLEDFVKNDYFELWVSAPNNGDVALLSDMSIFIQSQ
jgi:hypothetical protein